MEGNGSALPVILNYLEYMDATTALTGTPQNQALAVRQALTVRTVRQLLFLQRRF